MHLSLYNIPFLRFWKIVVNNGGLSRKGLLHLAPWMIKTTLLEPIRWIELSRYHKKIKNYQIAQPPVFILGHYRSGTTYLQRMFMQDGRYGYTSLFQTVLPEIMLTCEQSLTPVLDKISRILKLNNPFHRIPLQWHRFPGEEDVGTTSLLYTSAAQWGQLFPLKMMYYLDKYVLQENSSDAEAAQWKKEYLFFLKKVSLANSNKPLVLKNPPNTARIKTLLSLFPDAKFIHISRDPFEVFASTKRLWEVIIKNYSLGSFQNVAIDTLILDAYSKIMDRYLIQKDLIPPGRLIEITYEQFIQQPIACMRSIYTGLDLFHFQECEKAMTAFAGEQKKYSVLHHQVLPETKKIVSQKWERHINYWSQQMKAANE